MRWKMKHCELPNNKDCQEEVTIKPNKFYWRGKYFSGLVCEKCNALYDNHDDSFMKHVGVR